MLNRATILLLVLGLAPTVWSEEVDPAEAAIARTASEVLGAHAKDDKVALAAIASRATPDVWLVVDRLLVDDATDAAKALAAARTLPDGEALRAYVAMTSAEVPKPGDRVNVVRRNALAASRLYEATEYKDAADRLGAAARAAEAMGWLEQASRALTIQAYAYRQLKQPEDAVKATDHALALAERLTAPDLLRNALRGSVSVHGQLRDNAKAARVLERWAELERDEGQVEASWQQTVRAISAHHTAGSIKDALRVLDAAHRHAAKGGHTRIEVLAYLRASPLHQALGRYRKALTSNARARKLAAEHGLTELEAQGWVAEARLNGGLGRYADGIKAIDEAARLVTESSPTRLRVAVSETHGLLLTAIGRHKESEVALLAALELMPEREQLRRAHVLGNLAIVKAHLGEMDGYLQVVRETRAIYEAHNMPQGVARALGQEAATLGTMGRADEARPLFDRALALYEQLKLRRGVAETRSQRADLELGEGQYEEAATRFEQVEREAERLRAGDLWYDSLLGLATARHRLGRHELAIETAKRGVRVADDITAGLAESEAASARARYSSIFAIGRAAAAAEGDLHAYLYFLENSRAGALLESLGIAETLSGAIPEELRTPLDEARRALGAAQGEYEHAVQGGKRKVIRAAAKALDRARSGLRAAMERVQRERKSESNLLYPNAAPLDELTGSLAWDQVMVFYVLDEEAQALVVGEDVAGLVSLGPRDAIIEAANALELDNADGDPTAVLAALAQLVIEPLKDELGDDIKTVYISPDGALSFVPFVALLPKAAVAYVPSGSTFTYLLEQPEVRGTEILALGDPVYGGTSSQPGGHRGGRAARGKLSPLPATRAEVEAIGTVKLLGADATLARLRASLATQEAWSAVHLACHGLLDASEPHNSSLAISADPKAKHDGFLYPADLLGLKMPASLVVLSACETGRGKVVRGEGIMGLTRSFMHAGAQRVLASLWKVDDDATAALMRKFYELWTPPSGARQDPEKTVSASQALRAAQAFVRGHEKWKHPYYWAAWALWGLE